MSCTYRIAIITLVALPLYALAAPEPCNPAASQKTKQLYKQLHRWSEDTMLVGHQNSTLYGVYWSNDTNRSDIRDVTGSGPAIYGWDLLEISTSPQPSSYEVETLARLHKEIIAAHSRGAINTISWHMRNPITNGKYNDLSATAPIAASLPSGSAHEAYCRMLDKAATFFNSLRDADNAPIPILFRPYHEMNGDWFWWRTQRDPQKKEQLKQLWRFTQGYLQDKHKVNNLLWVYAPSRFAIAIEDATNTNEYLQDYPGDAHVDVLGLDNYIHFSDPSTSELAISQLETIVNLAESKNKLAALTETGADKIARDDWFTNCLLDPIESSPIARHLSYCMFWRNADENHFFTPPPRHPASEDFIRFRHAPFTVFESDLPPLDGRAATSDHKRWLHTISGAAIDRLWRDRTAPTWQLAEGAHSLFSGFDPHTQNARPARTSLKTTFVAPRTTIEPSDFDWQTKTTSIVIGSQNGPVEPQLPAFVHGGGETGSILRFQTNYPSQSVFSTEVESVSLSGAAITISIDGVHARTQHYPVSQGSVQLGRSPAWVKGDIAVSVPPGLHTISITNPEAGWVRIDNVESYIPAPSIKVYGVAGDTQARLWLHNQTRAKDLGATFATSKTTLEVHDLSPGIWVTSFIYQPTMPTVERTCDATGSIQIELPTIQNSLGIRLTKKGE